MSITATLAAELVSAPLEPASQAPANQALFKRLSRPLPWFHPKKTYYGLVQTLLRTVGKLSDGVALGWDAGFDSGSMLDYVYQNQPRGRGWLGRWLDRRYLNSPGWHGIRQRRRNLQALLTETLQRFERPVHIVDVAAGAGSYILDVLAALSEQTVTALCQDQDLDALALGRRAVTERGLDGRVQFAVGDAFDPDLAMRLQPRPDVAVVSGLYELFADDLRVAQSLIALHEALADDGFLLYTNQPWHPQLELIARTLTNREGRPWVMRPRPQAEMDALVRLAGFEPVETRRDADGIFTVTVARKRRGC